MPQGNPTHAQMCQIIGSVYSDAYLRIESLEKDNNTLREDQHKVAASAKKIQEDLREEIQRLKSEIDEMRKKWNTGNGNSMLPESLLQKLESKSKESPSSPSPSPENSDISPQKSIETPEKKRKPAVPLPVMNS